MLEAERGSVSVWAVAAWKSNLALVAQLVVAAALREVHLMERSETVQVRNEPDLPGGAERKLQAAQVAQKTRTVMDPSISRKINSANPLETKMNITIP